MTRLARELAAGGVASLRWDFAGLGQSGGDFARTTLSSDVGDLVEASDWLEEETGMPPVLLGHSMGGAASILAGRETRCPGIVLLAASSNLERVRRMLNEKHRKQLEAEGMTRIDVVGRPYPITQEFLSDLEGHAILEVISKWNRPLLIFHGTADETVPIEEGEKLFSAARQPKSFIAIQDARHLFDRPQDAQTISSFLLPWITRTSV